MVLIENISYEFVIVSEIINDGSKAGDTRRYDKLSSLQNELDGIFLQLRQEHLARVLHQRDH